jgi:cytochrome c biogenesis protein CcmG, thiol:disulfide interchange protein DsbE
MTTELGERVEVLDGRQNRPRWRLVAVVVAPLLLFAWLLASGLGQDPRELPSELEGDPAPAFSLTRLDEEGTIEQSGLDGQVVVLNFWASWCVPCREEHPALAAAWGRYRERGVVFVGIVFEDDPESALVFAQELGTDWPLATDPSSRTAIAYGVFGIPETFVIAPDGTIAAKRVGAVDYAWLTEEIDGAIRSGTDSG